MNRRGFLLRTAGSIAGLFLSRSVRAAASNGLAPAAGVDSSAAGPGTAPPPSSGTPADSSAASRGAARGPTASLAVGGDTTLGYNLEAHFDQQVQAGVPKEQLWPLYFAGVRSILDQADVALVNLECPFTERGTKLTKNFNFRARRELVRILSEGSVDVVSVANNHAADYGRAGLKDTLKTLDGAGIEHFGAGMNLREARRPAILARKGLKLGFLGYYFQAEPDMLEPEEVYATQHHPGVAGCYKDLECVRAQITEDLEHLVSKVDVAIPYFHWGKEGSYDVQPYQVELAHLCVDLGCKAVMGSHPHRLQGVEVYREAPIFYSLGNFVYGGIKEPKDTLTAIARLEVGRDRVKAELVPVQFTRWPEAPFQPFVLEAEAREEALRRAASYAQGFERTLPQLEAYRAATPAAEAKP
ncbi:MAG TPA: CapA family protein [Candidatus Eisenbacteria bacterium]|jgi:poly-gamma-glutamate synthesis protein (capsule biosynthesis protein)